MKKFYLTTRDNTIAYQQAPDIPDGFFLPKAIRDKELENEQLVKEYEQLHEDKWAKYEINF